MALLVSLVLGCGTEPSPETATPPVPEPSTEPLATGQGLPNDANLEKPVEPSVAGPTTEHVPDRAEAHTPTEAELARTGSLRGPTGITPDDERAAAAGIRKITGRQFTLYTDLPPSPEVDRLPEVFDQAPALWAEYLGVPAKLAAEWRITGFLMRSRERFAGVGLLPDTLPDFRHGTAEPFRIWWDDQATDYYRRHLMLHEGVHAFMVRFLGNCGPVWYMEGTAELLGTHRVADGQLEVGYWPRDPDEVPGLGRIALVQRNVAAGSVKSVAEVMAFLPGARDDNATYGWCWAAAAFLDGHPRYAARFRELPRHANDDDFNAAFRSLFADDLAELDEEWQLFVREICHGHDLARTAIKFTSGVPLAAAGKEVHVTVDRGWQSSGLRLEAGTSYALRAAGRFRLKEEPTPWWSEPGGVSIHYHHGRPLGMLLAAVRPDEATPGTTTALADPWPVGLGMTITPSRGGTLYFRVNDSPAGLFDNHGDVVVNVAPAH